MILNVFYNCEHPRSTVADTETGGLEVVLHTQGDLCLKKTITDQRIIHSIRTSLLAAKMAKLFATPTLVERLSAVTGQPFKREPDLPAGEIEVDFSGPIGILIGGIFGDIRDTLKKE